MYAVKWRRYCHTRQASTVILPQATSLNRLSLTVRRGTSRHSSLSARAAEPAAPGAKFWQAAWKPDAAPLLVIAAILIVPVVILVAYHGPIQHHAQQRRTHLSEGLFTALYLNVPSAARLNHQEDPVNTGA